ncbi:hypothetical protein GGS21DRAFT_8698 [Xylaria nigripes]|nr:hypothetical protein GGS21DRAFT_8698 [Xylaria nigripes]
MPSYAFSAEYRSKIYLQWRAVFSQKQRYRLRKRKTIESVVREYDRHALDDVPDLVGILQSLLRDCVFESSLRAYMFFPELFYASKDDSDQKSHELLSGWARYHSDDLHTERTELFDSFKELYLSEEYSDLEIVCKEKKYRVHKSIVCPRSKFFTAACRGGFKESQEGKIDLSADDPQAVEIMIWYFYHLDYNSCLPQVVDGMDRTFVTCPYSNHLYTTTNLMIHVKVYNLADKYFVEGLKGQASAKFRKVAHDQWETNEFLEAAQEVYTSTTETDRGMRDIVVETFSNHISLLDKEKTMDVLKKHSGLAYDLLKKLYREKRIHERDLWTWE